MDCAAAPLALRVIFAVAKMHQLAALGSNPRYGSGLMNVAYTHFPLVDNKLSPFDHSGTSP